MVSFMISNRTTKPGPSDVRRVMYGGENLRDEVHMMEQ